MSDNIPNCDIVDEALEHRRNYTTLNEKFGIMKDWLIPPDYLGLIRPQDPNAVQVRELFDRMCESVRSMPAIPIVTTKAMLPEEVTKMVGRRIDVMALYRSQRASIPESDYSLDYILSKKEIDEMLERPLNQAPNEFRVAEPRYLTLQRGKHRNAKDSTLFYSLDPSLGPMNISRTEITYDANGIATTTIETVLFAGDIRGNLVTVIRRQKRVQQK